MIFTIFGLLLIIQYFPISININQNLTKIEHSNHIKQPFIATGNWAPNGKAICTSPLIYRQPQIIPDDNGGAIICWYDTTLGKSDIYAQRIDSNGNSLWGPNGTIICNEVDYQRYCRMSSDGNGGAIIVWNDRRDGSSSHIYAQKINETGVVQWKSNGTVVCNESVAEEYLDICSDGNGGAIITWIDWRDLGSDVYAQRIDSNGINLWTPNGTLICDAIGYQSRPKIVSDNSINSIIVWEDFRNGRRDIYTQRVNSTGAIKWQTNGIVICNFTADQWFPKICQDGQGGGIITWEDYRNAIPNSMDIYAQRIDKEGNTLWVDNGTEICTSPMDQKNVELCPDGNGGAIIAWTDYRNIELDVYVQKINSSGNTSWTVDGLKLTRSGYQAAPQISSNGNGGAFVVFTDNRLSESGLSIQHIDESGNLAWNPNGMYITKAIGSQQEQKICITTNGYPLVTWQDNRDFYDIYASIIIEMPISNHPSDIITDRFGTEVIDWIFYGTVTSPNGRFRIFANNTKGNIYLYQSWTIWTNGTNTSIPINRSLPGTFLYYVEFQDTEYYYGGYDEVYVEIVDQSPYTNQPPDIITNITDWDMIEWIIYDDYFEGSFRVIINDTNNNYYVWMDWNPWRNGTTISVPINRIALGTFNYTIEFTTSAGYLVKDSILVTIIEPPDDDDGDGDGDDKYEDNDTSVNAAEITDGIHSNLIRLDDDWYKVYVYEDYTFEVTIWFNHSESNLQLLIYNITLTELDSSQTSSNIETVSIVASYTGYHFINVWTANGSTLYNMEIKVYLPSANGDGDGGLNIFDLLPYAIGCIALLLSLITIILIAKLKGKMS